MYFVSWNNLYKEFYFLHHEYIYIYIAREREREREYFKKLRCYLERSESRYKSHYICFVTILEKRQKNKIKEESNI